VEEIGERLQFVLESLWAADSPPARLRGEATPGPREALGCAVEFAKDDDRDVVQIASVTARRRLANASTFCSSVSPGTSSHADSFRGTKRSITS
jgi:hypothetical protein